MRTNRGVNGLSQSSLRRDRLQFPFGPYLPTRNLMFEHRAESLLGADASGISEWAAYSRPYTNPTGVAGSGNWAGTQGTAGNQPTCKTNIISGYSVARFDGNDWLDIPNTGSNGGALNPQRLSYFAVMKCTSSTPRTLFAGAGSSVQVRLNNSKVELLKAGSTLMGTASTTLDTATFYSIGVSYDSTLASANVKFYLNGATDGTANNTTDLSQGAVFIGKKTSGGSDAELFLGDIVHDAFYGDTLTNLEIAQIFNVFQSLYKHH